MPEVNIEPLGDDAVSVQGDLIFATAMDAIKQLQDQMSYKESLRVDLAQVLHADSSALAVILEAQSLARRDECQIVFTNLPDVLQVLVKVARLDSIVALE